MTRESIFKSYYKPGALLSKQALVLTTSLPCVEPYCGRSLRSFWVGCETASQPKEHSGNKIRVKNELRWSKARTGREVPLHPNKKRDGCERAKVASTL